MFECGDFDAEKREDLAEIQFIEVKESFRGEGIGKKLIHDSLDLFKANEIDEVVITLSTESGSALIRSFERGGQLTELERCGEEVLYRINR